MIQFLIHLAQWLSLVIPAIALSQGIRWLWRGWFNKIWLYKIGAWLGGLIVIALGGYLIMRAIIFILDKKLAACRLGTEYYLCGNQHYKLGYLVFILLIAWGLYFVNPLFLKLYNALKALLKKA